MALLRTEADWKTFLRSAGIQDDATLTTYAGLFVTNGFNEVSLGEINKDTLHELGVTVLGHKLAILAGARKRTAPVVPQVATRASVTAKLTTVTHDMTHQQFRKFLQDWNVYK